MVYLPHSSRTPVDPDAYVGRVPKSLRSMNERPDVRRDGKVVLVGNPVVFHVEDLDSSRTAQSNRTRSHNKKSEIVYIDDEIREQAESSSQMPRTPRFEANEFEFETNVPPKKRNGGPLLATRNVAHANGSGAWPSWFGAQEGQKQTTAFSLAASKPQPVAGWNWFRGTEAQHATTHASNKNCGLNNFKQRTFDDRDDSLLYSPASTPSSTGGWSLFGFGSATTTRNEHNDDESTVDGGGSLRFVGDLANLSSVNGEDVTIAADSMRSTDFQCRGAGASVGNSDRVDKKLREIVETKQNADPSTRKKSGGGEMSTYNRRQLLVKELRSAIAMFGRYDVRCADISAALGDLLNETEEFEQAVKLHKDALLIYSVNYGDDHLTTTTAKLRLATVLACAGEHDEAISTYYQVTAMRRALYGDRDPSVADGLVLMARCLKKNGECQSAIKELKRALKIFREALGDSNEKVSQTVDDIASLYVTLGDYEKSAAILEEVVKLKATTLGMRSPAVAETFASLAMTYECLEEYVQAMKALKKAYKIYTEIGGYSSVEATATLMRIALLYQVTGDYNRASIAFLGVLRGQKIHLGDDHLEVGETYCNLGHALRETGQLEKALKCMKEALPIYVGKGVEMHDVEKIAEIMHEMALIYEEKKHYSEASRIFKQELSVRRKIGQPEFPFIARTLNHLGVTEFEMRNNSRALKYLVEALTIFQEKNEHGMDCAEVLYNTGLVFSAVRNKDRALEAFTEAERLFQDSGCVDSHPFLVNVQKEISKIRLVTNNRRPK
jgi:tetratricopeptide (TPR) repeat protein